MKYATLNRTITEAKRFIAIAERVKVDNYGFIVDCCKEVSATKRASMDLTRTLAELRKV